MYMAKMKTTDSFVLDPSPGRVGLKNGTLVGDGHSKTVENSKMKVTPPHPPELNVVVTLQIDVVTVLADLEHCNPTMWSLVWVTVYTLWRSRLAVGGNTINMWWQHQ
jgi:hypothetical protein